MGTNKYANRECLACRIGNQSNTETAKHTNHVRLSPQIAKLYSRSTSEAASDTDPPNGSRQEGESERNGDSIGSQTESHQSNVAETVAEWFQRHSHQLTGFGLSQLHDGMRDDEIVVLFRNDHYSTMIKHNGNLYLLVSDLGYLRRPDIVFQKLVNAHGDGEFVNGKFQPFLFREQDEQTKTQQAQESIQEQYQIARAIEESKRLAESQQQASEQGVTVAGRPGMSTNSAARPVPVTHGSLARWEGMSKGSSTCTVQ